jgi:hypothetical protein
MTQNKFIKEFRDLLRKYEIHISADDHYNGYPECGQDIKISIESMNHDIDIDLEFDWIDSAELSLLLEKEAQNDQ